MTWSPCLVRVGDRGGRPVLRLGHPRLDRYLEFVSARARPNTTLAAGYDLKVFFSVVEKDPVEVPLVVRLSGTNIEEGRKILTSSGLPIIRASTLAEAAERVVEAWQRDRSSKATEAQTS